ncbi:MAG TPA: response regulator [Pyrinomonadaceae bacterium]|jgi:twitching motility two-component system response regulator PilH
MITPNENSRSDSQPSLPQTPAVTQPRSTRGTILLVEDDRSIRRYLEVILQRAGYTVVAAADGLEAMKAALSNRLDAVITDAIMPHLNGYELCRFLRRHPKMSQLPVILLSGVERADSSQEEADRADVYLSKPVRPEELTRSVARLLLKAA